MSILFVLAGGRGTRLSTAVPDRPKALAPIGTTPFLEILVRQWVREGVSRMVFLLGHRAVQIERWIADRWKVVGGRCRCDIVIEPAPLGTGGAIAFGVRQIGIDDAFAVANADTWFPGAIGALKGQCPPALAAARVSSASRFGSLELEGTRLVKFREKPADRSGGLINGGSYCFRPEHFELWDGRPMSLERDVLPGLIPQGLSVIEVDAPFIDIGIPEDLERFTTAFIKSPGQNTFAIIQDETSQSDDP